MAGGRTLVPLHDTAQRETRFCSWVRGVLALFLNMSGLRLGIKKKKETTNQSRSTFAPAFLSAFEYTAPDDEDLLWSLRFFNARLMRCGRQTALQVLQVRPPSLEPPTPHRTRLSAL